MELERVTFLNGGVSLVTLVGLIFGVPVFAYSNFVTIRDRDAMRAITLDRISVIEHNQTDVIQEVSELKGKIDTLILLMNQDHENRKR